MMEQQELQSLLRLDELQSLLPIEGNERFKYLLSLVPFEKKDLLDTLQGCFELFLCFEDMPCKALTEEDLLSVEEQKQLFFNKIGLDEDSLKDILKHGIDFFLRAYRASTDEELQSIVEERDCFLKDNLNFTALEKYIREKRQKYTSPAA